MALAALNACLLSWLQRKAEATDSRIRSNSLRFQAPGSDESFDQLITRNSSGKAPGRPGPNGQGAIRSSRKRSSNDRSAERRLCRDRFLPADVARTGLLGPRGMSFNNGHQQ